MGNPDTFCVGCDEATGGTYRPDANWSLCDSCYSDWQETDADADADEKRQLKIFESYENCDKCGSRNIRYSMTIKEDCCWDCGSTSFTLRP
jgi:hypothetical protein